MAKHVPLRRCVVCRATRPQAELLRFYKLDDVWQLDAQRKSGGRGAWLCRDRAACQRPKTLKRFFRSEAENVAAQVSGYLSAHGAHAVTSTGTRPAPHSEPQTATQTEPNPHHGGTNVR